MVWMVRISSVHGEILHCKSHKGESCGRRRQHLPSSSINTSALVNLLVCGRVIPLPLVLSFLRSFWCSRSCLLLRTLLCRVCARSTLASRGAGRFISWFLVGASHSLNIAITIFICADLLLELVCVGEWVRFLIKRSVNVIGI